MYRDNKEDSITVQIERPIKIFERVTKIDYDPDILDSLKVHRYHIRIWRV